MVSGLNLSSKLHMLNFTQIVAYKTSNPDKANVNKNVAIYNDQYEFKCTNLQDVQIANTAPVMGPIYIDIKRLPY